MKRRKRRLVAALMLAVLVTTVQGAGAVVTGSIFGPGSQSFPIAVTTLKNLGGDQNAALGQRFAAVLSRDLDLSGYFRVLDPKTFIEDPQSSGLDAGETDFVGWAAIGAQAVVKGGITVTGDTVSIEFRMFDVPGRSEVSQVGKRYSGSKADLPRMAHKAADGILEFLTGERGPFDSMIALVSTGGARLKDVYRYTFDMDAPARVTDERSIVVTPRWKPDARAILFTSYRQLSAVHDLLAGRLPYRLLRQGEAPRDRLLEWFRDDVSSVLLATTSFWQGVDVPGEALSLVVIDRLPFTPPDDPILSARTEAAARAGRSGFEDVQLPRAAMLLKQGFGRLLRSETDRGVVAILDRRLVTKPYGRYLQAALPDVPRLSDPAGVAAFLGVRIGEQRLG